MELFDHENLVEYYMEQLLSPMRPVILLCVGAGGWRRKRLKSNTHYYASR